ncbi:MAG: hypothetical protein MHMPM18_003688 [Marteilia pararefringens]
MPEKLLLILSFFHVAISKIQFEICNCRKTTNKIRNKIRYRNPQLRKLTNAGGSSGSNVLRDCRKYTRGEYRVESLVAIESISETFLCGKTVIIEPSFDYDVAAINDNARIFLDFTRFLEKTQLAALCAKNNEVETRPDISVTSYFVILASSNIAIIRQLVPRELMLPTNLIDLSFLRSSFPSGASDDRESQAQESPEFLHRFSDLKIQSNFNPLNLRSNIVGAAKKVLNARRQRQKSKKN